MAASMHDKKELTLYSVNDIIIKTVEYDPFCFYRTMYYIGMDYTFCLLCFEMGVWH